MATRVTTYNPADVIVSVAGNRITGFAPGRMVEHRMDVVVWTDAIGVDNEPVRWALHNPFSTLTLTLLQSSTANFILGGILNLDKITGAQVAPVIVQDKSGDGVPTRIITKTAWINTQPAMVWSQGIEVRQWVLRLVDPIHDIRGLDRTSAISL